MNHSQHCCDNAGILAKSYAIFAISLQVQSTTSTCNETNPGANDVRVNCNESGCAAISDDRQLDPEYRSCNHRTTGPKISTGLDVEPEELDALDLVGVVVGDCVGRDIA